MALAIMAVGDGYGGLEHRHSTALICTRRDLPQLGLKKQGDGYTTLLGLIEDQLVRADVIVTSGGGEESGAVDRPARSGATTTTKSRTTATTKSGTATTQTVPASSGRFVKVQPGDTPTSIADRSGAGSSVSPP